MTDREKNRLPETSLATGVVFFGALWGLLESTLGYGLHLLSRLVPGSGLAGMVMYPIAFALMYGAYRSTKNIFAPLLVSVVAAAVKLSSAALPSVALIFVTNPALAILAEGAVVTVIVAVWGTRGRYLVGGAAIGAVLWRAIFLGLVVMLPVQKGILMKGTQALLIFLLVESAVNAAVIGIGLWIAGRARHARTRTQGPLMAILFSRPVFGALLLVVAVTTEAGLSGL